MSRRRKSSPRPPVQSPASTEGVPGQPEAPTSPPFMARDRMMFAAMKESAADFWSVTRQSIPLQITYLSFAAAMIAGLFSDYWMSVVLLFVTTPAAGFAGLHAYMGTLSNMAKRD